MVSSDVVDVKEARSRTFDEELRTIRAERQALQRIAAAMVKEVNEEVSRQEACKQWDHSSIEAKFEAVAHLLQGERGEGEAASPPLSRTNSAPPPPPVGHDDPKVEEKETCSGL